MKVITVSREYGAGGGEVARLLSAQLGWELLDRELLHRAAALEHVPDEELERLDEKALTLAERFSLNPPHQRYMHRLTEVVREAAARGNVILVGRGGRQLLGDLPDAFHLRLVAPQSWRAHRMAQREGWSEEQALARCREVDRSRERFARYFFGATVAQVDQYDLVVNTGRVPLDQVAACVAEVVQEEGSSPQLDQRLSAYTQARAEPASVSGPRLLTLARQLGAANGGFARTLAVRLDLRVFDRELLEQEAVRLGVSEADLARVDEQPAGVLQRLLPGNLHHRYFEALGQLMNDLADRGHVLLVGRGGCRFLWNRPEAFHVRLVASADFRLRRVMEHHWLREEQARQLIADTDGRRRRFYEMYFGADWADPLEYHLTVNSGRLGPATIDLIALAAERYWTTINTERGA